MNEEEFVIERSSDGVTWEEIEWFGIKRKVRFIPLWKWLLDIDLKALKKSI